MNGEKCKSSNVLFQMLNSFIQKYCIYLLVCRNGKPLNSIYIITKITHKVTDPLNVSDFFHSHQILKFPKKVKINQLFKIHYKPTK